MRQNASLAMDFRHFSCSARDACCCLLYSAHRHTDTNSYPLTHWAAEDKRAADKSDHWCHLSPLAVSLSFAETQKHTYLKTPRHRHHCHDLMYCNVHFTSMENAGQYQSQKTDKPSNKDSIFNVWSHTENDKSQKQTAARHTGKHRQNHHIAIHLYMIIQWAKWLISWFQCLHSTMLLLENATEKKLHFR